MLPRVSPDVPQPEPLHPWVAAAARGELPDWAVVELNTPPGSRYPGKIVLADFFDEKWALKPLPTAAAPESK